MSSRIGAFVEIHQGASMGQRCNRCNHRKRGADAAVDRLDEAGFDLSNYCFLNSGVSSDSAQSHHIGLEFQQWVSIPATAWPDRDTSVPVWDWRNQLEYLSRIPPFCLSFLIPLKEAEPVARP